MTYIPNSGGVSDGDKGDITISVASGLLLEEAAI